jgi:hypothetical protein
MRTQGDIIDSLGEFGRSGEVLATADSSPTTMLEAVIFRAHRQRTRYQAQDFPLTGSFTLPCSVGEVRPPREQSAAMKERLVEARSVAYGAARSRSPRTRIQTARWKNDQGKGTSR